VTDVDGNDEDHSDTVSVFNGPALRIQVLSDAEEECAVVGRWLAECASAGILPHEIGAFVRSAAQICRADDAVRLAELPCQILDGHVATEHDHVSVSTTHLAKGLEFRSVAVMACDDEVIPLQQRSVRRSLDSRHSPWSAKRVTRRASPSSPPRTTRHGRSDPSHRNRGNLPTRCGPDWKRACSTRCGCSGGNRRSAGSMATMRAHRLRSISVWAIGRSSNCRRRSASARSIAPRRPLCLGAVARRD